MVGESADFRAVDRVGVGGLRLFRRSEAAGFGDHFRKLGVEVSAVPSDRREFDASPIIERNEAGADVEATSERRFKERPSVGVGRGTETARRFPNDAGGQRLETEEERPKTLFVIAVGKVFKEHRLILGAKKRRWERVERRRFRCRGGKRNFDSAKKALININDKTGEPTTLRTRRGGGNLGRRTRKTSPSKRQTSV